MLKYFPQSWNAFLKYNRRDDGEDGRVREE